MIMIDMTRIMIKYADNLLSGCTQHARAVQKLYKDRTHAEGVDGFVLARYPRSKRHSSSIDTIW